MYDINVYAAHLLRMQSSIALVSSRFKSLKGKNNLSAVAHTREVCMNDYNCSPKMSIITAATHVFPKETTKAMKNHKTLQGSHNL